MVLSVSSCSIAGLNSLVQVCALTASQHYIRTWRRSSPVSIGFPGKQVMWAGWELQNAPKKSMDRSKSGVSQGHSCVLPGVCRSLLYAFVHKIMELIMLGKPLRSSSPVVSSIHHHPTIHPPFISRSSSRAAWECGTELSDSSLTRKWSN